MRRFRLSWLLVFRPLRSHSLGRHRSRAKGDRRVIRSGRATARRAVSQQVSYPSRVEPPLAVKSAPLQHDVLRPAFSIILLIRLGLRFSSFDPFTEEGEIWKPQSQMKLGNFFNRTRP